MANSDMQKRKEIYLEFVYYIFDSLLIPLIRSNFHVTESNTHRNRLFFFRHDVWRRLTEPSLTALKLSMFEEMKPTQAKHLLNARVLGFSQIRLLPKKTGFRPIMNLRRRINKKQSGKVVLGRSINSVMAPVFNMLDYEKEKQPYLVGTALFSVGEMYPKLKAFRSHLQSRHSFGKPLYFVKLDVQSCFDTIPQRRVVRLVEDIASEDAYKIARHAEIKSSVVRCHDPNIRKTPVPTRKFIASARAPIDFQPFAHRVESSLAIGKKNTIFVDSIVQTTQQRHALLELLEEHVERNVVKIGKRFFRQKAGIPQGSVLSSLLCNFFYAELEREYLGFIDADESILMRLVDDFLLITTNKDHAERFSHIMHGGIEKYGVQVSLAKSLANFGMTVHGHRVPRLEAGTSFPYCGNMIDTRSLEITKDTARRQGTGAGLFHQLTISTSLTRSRSLRFTHSRIVEDTRPDVSPESTQVYSNNRAIDKQWQKANADPSAFKIQTHKMFLDTNFNSLRTVLSSIFKNFAESSMKYYRYAKCMAAHPPVSLLIRKSALVLAIPPASVFYTAGRYPSVD